MSGRHCDVLNVNLLLNFSLNRILAFIHNPHDNKKKFYNSLTPVIDQPLSYNTLYTQTIALSD